MADELTLNETDRKKLDGIVQQMTANKEADADIQFVVNDFKTKYGQKKSLNATTSGAKEVLPKDGEPQLEPSTVSGTKGDVEVAKAAVAPAELPTSYTNDRNNKKDLQDGGKYNLLRGGKPIVGTWDAANDRFIKDKLIDYTPQEKVGEGFIEKASRLTGVKVVGGQLVKTDDTKPPKETEEEAFARATAEAEEIEKDVVKKVLNADYLTSYPQLQQLQQLQNQLELAPENKKAEISAKINELRVKKLDSDEFVGTRLKGDEEVYQNFMPAPRVGEELVPTTKDGLLKLPKTDMTIGEAYDEVVNDGEYVADATQEIQNLQQNLIDFKVSKLPEVDRKELDALRGTAEYDEAVTKKLAESEEVSNWFIAGAFGLKDKIDAIIRIGEGIGVDDEAAKAQAIRNIKRQEIFGIKPKTFGAEMTYSVGGMLPDIAAGSVYAPAMFMSMMSTMPSDYIDASVYEDYVNGRPIDMNKARKYATASTIAQGGLLMGAGKIGSHGLKLVSETNLGRSLELMTEMAKRGTKDAVLFGTLGHLMQNKINKAFKLAENDDYLKQSLHMAVIGMLFAFKEGSGKVIKLPKKAASEVDYLASYLPRDYTQKQVEQFIQMGKMTASEGEAVLKKLDDYRLINAEFGDNLTQSEIEAIYPLWLQKVELKKSLVGQTSEMASHINGQIKDLDRKILIASRLPLTTDEKLEKQKLTLAQATGGTIDKYQLDYLNKRAEKYKEKQAELKAEEDEYKAKQEEAKAEEAKKVVEAVQTPTETVTEAEVVTPIAPDGGEGATDGTGKQKTWGKLTKMPHQEGKGVEIDNAPDGNFINVGLQIGQTTELIPEGDVASNLPKDVKILSQTKMVDDFGEPFLSLELSRPLTKAELLKLQEATQQLDIPQLSGKKGTMYGTQQYGLFDPTKMTLPDGTRLSNATTTSSTTKNNFKPNKVLTGANKIISGIADAYKKANRLFSKTPRLVTKVSDVDGKRIADAFNEMKHEPNNPEVKKGFEQLITEIKKQADALIKEGFKFELVTEGKAYNSDSKKMLNDVKNNKRILIEASEGAFGTKRTFDQDNIGLQDSGYTDVNGRKLTNVELIRAVHDLFGHSEYGNGFGAIGEENAWRVHMSMFTPLAQKALTATTRGQNSWVNFGNHMRNADGSIKKKGDAGYLEPNKRPFAEQKIGFLPDWAMENAYGDRVTVNGKEIKPTNKYVVDGKEAYEIDDAQAFFDAISSAKESRGDDGVQVALKTKEEYQKVLDEGGVLLVSKDGKVGVMLEANGNVGSGFAHADLPKGENSLKPLLITAIKLGGRFTDAYDGYLPKYYSRFGFKPSFRMKFNPEFADKGWEKTILKNEPDVVFMYFDGNRETLEADYNKFPDYDNTKGEYVTDYDKAVEATKAKSIELEDQASLTPPPDAKAGATKKETPQTETKVEQATEQVQKFKDVLDQRTDKKTDKALKAFGEQAEKAKELIDNYDTNLKKLEEKGVEVKGTKAEILADMLDGKYDEALKSDTSIPSSKTEIERRPITMLDGEEGIELIVKNADGTETSMGKFYATDTKEMDKIERGLKLADQQKAKGSDSKSEVQKANEEVWKAVQDLLDAGDITNLGFAAKNVGEKSAEALDRLHKTLVKAAKVYLKTGGNSVKQFARSLGITAKNVMKAWDEANGGKQYKADELDYDMVDIAKTAMRRGINVRKKLPEYKAKQKDIAKAIKDFMDDAEIKGALSPSQVKALVKRAASVNTDIQFENFIDYAEKVIADVNFAEDVAEIESAQRKANSRNHVSQNNIVKEFTSIPVERIPENLWDDYQEALADLSARVPSYKKMTDMYYSITQFAKQPSPFDAVKSFDEADKALKSALSNKIGTLDEYKQLLKDIRAFEKRVNGLFENGDITKQNYDDLLDTLSSKREKFDAQFGGQVGQLKDQLLAEANAVKKSKEFKDAVDKVDNKVDKDLLNELSVQTDEDLKALSPQALADLADVYQNVIDGYVDHYRIRDIVAKSEGARNGKQVKEQIAKAKIEVANVGELAEEMGVSEAAFREGDIGLGRAKAGEVTKYIYDPILRAITKSQNQTQNGVKLLKDAFGNHNKQSRLRMGIVANALQEYMAQFNPEFANVKDIGNRDWVAEIFAKGNANGFNSLEEANAVAKAWYSLNKGKATIKSPLPIIGKNKLAEISGDPISPKEIYDSFIANDGKFLTKEEHKALSTWFEYAGDTNFNTQRAANEMKGKEMNKEPFYAPRIREGSNIFGEDNVTLDEKSTRISITSGFGKSRTSQAIEPIQFDISISGEKAIANANKDYELTKALKEVNATLDAALKDGADPSVIEAIKKDVQHSLSNQYNNKGQRDFTDKVNRLLSTSIQLNPLKTVKEFAATISSMPIRGGKLQGIAELFKANGFKELIEYTGSPLSERFNINKQFELTDGEVEDLRPLQKLAYLLGGLPELTMMQTVYMPNFKAEFKAITGNEYSARDFKNDPSYRVKNYRALRDANAVATNEVQKIIGGGSKFSARRDIKIPFGKVKADTFTGKAIGFMGGYPYREQKEFWNGFKEVAERRKEGEGVASLGSLRKPLAVTINTMVYSYMGAMLKTMVAQVMDEKEEKEKEKLLEEKFTPKGVTSALVGQLSNVTAAKYGSIGTNLTKSAFAIAAYNLEDEEQQKILTSIAKENFFGMQPDFERLTSENKYARQTAMKLEMAKLIPAIGEAVTAWDAMGSSYESAADLFEAKKQGKSLTKNDEEIYNLLNLSINALHLAMMTQGGGVPSYYDLQKIIESRKKKQPQGIVN